MKDNNLLASVALFSELYNNDQYHSVTDILGEFIKGVVVSHNKWTITSTELTLLLEKSFDFKIPESVIRSTVKNRLKDVVSLADGHYTFDTKIKESFHNLDDEFLSISLKQKDIIAELVKFVEVREHKTLLTEEKEVLTENLIKYLLDNGVTEKYSKYISAFIIKNQNNTEFTESLNLIREGIVLYQGIKYTADLNELGKWKDDLTIFLSTEHLFNAVGYNGVLFKQIFDDFYNLVTEINLSNNKKGTRTIELKYFEETHDEINAFFQTAELILKGKAILDPSKSAMKEILNGCMNASDIKNKKIKFERELQLKGIGLQEVRHSIYDYPEYVVEDESVIEEMRKESEARGRFFDERICLQLFRIFTKINYFRGGESKSKFDKIGYIFMTANRFALHLSHQTKVKFDEDDIPYAKDIDYITNKFWFKLKKGFSNRSDIPKAFDVVTKAQIILSSQINQSVSQEYQKLQNQIKENILTKEEALQRSYELREKPNKPEDLTIDIIDKSLDFLFNDNYFEDMVREKQMKDELFNKTLLENAALQAKLENINRKELEERKEKEKILLYNEYKEKAIREWENYSLRNWRDFTYFLCIVVLNIGLVTTGISITISKDLKEWLGKFEVLQCFILGIYIFTIVIEIVGSKYIFNRNRLSNAWEWIKIILKYNKTKTNFIEDKICSYKSDKI